MSAAKKESPIEGNEKQLPDDRLWDKEEARYFLKLPQSTFNLQFAKGDIPSIKIGKHIRFIPEQLKAWAKKQLK